MPSKLLHRRAVSQPSYTAGETTTRPLAAATALDAVAQQLKNMSSHPRSSRDEQTTSATWSIPFHSVNRRRDDSLGGCLLLTPQRKLSPFLSSTCRGAANTA